MFDSFYVLRSEKEKGPSRVRQAFSITLIFYYRLNAGLTLTTLKVVSATTNMHLPKISLLFFFLGGKYTKIFKYAKNHKKKAV